MQKAQPQRRQKEPNEQLNDLFTLDRYSEEVFQGIMPDTGAAEQSTAGRGQFRALCKELPGITLDASRAGEAHIKFGNGAPMSSVGSVNIDTPVGRVTFHIVDAPTPFLLCLRDMDELGIELHNVRNELVSASGVRVPVYRKWGHAWFYPDGLEAGAQRIGSPDNPRALFLTEAELRHVHKRFGHPSVRKMHKFLTRAGEDVEISALELINRFCHYCQKHQNAPQRFKFKLHKEADFNHEILVDVGYFSGKPVLHVICESTGFQAGSFLTDMTAETTWKTLKKCWIDTYLGPPDVITTDSGTNFAAELFRAEAKLAGITCQQVPVEAHHSIGKIERAHKMLRRAYDIILEESGGSPEEALQAAFSAVNATAGPDGLVPTLLVFGAYPRISMDSPPSASQIQRANAHSKALGELRKLSTQRRLRDALNTRNGPDTERVMPLSLALGSSVLVWREGHKEWQGPFQVLSVTDKDVTVDMINGPTTFRSTVVRPYNRWNEQSEPQEESNQIPFEYPEPKPQRKRGRPTKQEAAARRAEERQSKADNKRITRSSKIHKETSFLTEKERKSYETAVELRAKGAIKTSGEPFELSDQAEIESLMEAGVIKAITLRPEHKQAKIFGCRLVREVKGQSTAQPYEKSRLVAQGYSDEEKRSLLTQAPTILRCSQRLILALVPSLMQQGLHVAIRDITQAYTQSETDLQRTVLLRLPRELRSKYPDNTVLKVIKPLYGLAEAGLHWFATYSEHHKRRLAMEPSGYDPCLLITRAGEPFGLVGLQTDDTLNVGSAEFLQKEESELKKAGFKAKPRSAMEPGSRGDFNGCYLEIDEDSITIRQKGQASKLELVDPRSQSARKQYVEQRARGAYIASICQPEAAFDYSVAAQEQEPGDPEIEALNKRIKWQIQEQQRGLRYAQLDLEKAKIYVFVDGSFANNRDLSSQIGYVIVLGNESSSDHAESFELFGNVLHWSSTKCKRVTRSVLASEIYGMSAGFDLGYVLNHTLATICERLQMKAPELVVCTDSRSLYQCLVQLGSTVEKRLMIDLMALRQSYEAREITEIRWINGEDNPADSMTKAAPNRALEALVSTNRASFRVEGWVQRAEDL